MINISLTLLVAVLSAVGVLGLVIWRQAPRQPINIIFALLSLSFIIWSGTSYYDQTAASTDALLPLLAGVPFAGATFISFFLVLFSIVFPESHPNSRRFKRGVIIALAVTTPPVVFLAVFSHLIIARVTSSPTTGNNVVLGPLYGLFTIYFLGWMGTALINLYRKFRHTSEQIERLQISYIFIGLFLTMFVGFLTNVVIPILTGDATTARFGFLTTLFLSGFIGYAVAAHRLFNIKMLVARSVTYVLVLSTFAATYGFFIFAVANVFFPQHALDTAEIGIFVVFAVILAFTLEPLRRFFEKATESVFFRDRYDSQVVLSTVGSILASELILDTMLDKTIKEICGNLHIATARFVVYEKGQVYKRTFYGMTPAQLIDTNKIQRLRPGTLVADEMRSGQRKDILTKNGIRVSMELWANDEVVGHLLLGDKLSGEMYSNQDITLLEILRKELAVAIANARAYEQISLFNTTLQERVTKATAHLRAANVKLEVLDKAKDDFISMASHQLGTPLAAITGFLSMALTEDRKNMTDSQRDSVSVALESAERLVNMASDLLNVSRLNAGRFSIVRQPVDLARMIAQEVLQLEPSAGRKNLELTFTPPAQPLPMVPIDESKTRQVIMNFIDNAIYYTPKGSIKVTLVQDDTDVELRVTDTGMGVPPDEVPKLFAKFYRAPNAKEARPDGTGLGLYLAKKVIEDQGGQLIFETKLGQGSTFGFKLPLKPKPVKKA